MYPKIHIKIRHRSHHMVRDCLVANSTKVDRLDVGERQVAGVGAKT